MRTFSMCFSIFQIPRRRIHSLTNIWHETAYKTYGNKYGFHLINSHANAVEGGYSRRWIRPLSSKSKGTRKNSQNRNSQEQTIISQEIVEEAVSTSITLNVNKKAISEFQKIQYCDIQQKIAENNELAKLFAVIVFDLETTGFSRHSERIIEIAMQDLQGGENSTFQTLVNPERYVANSNIHKITTHMVSRPGIPRMKDLIPILLQYIRSRHKPGGYVLFVAHNGRKFDAPFLIEEFKRNGYEFPPNCLFLDSLSLVSEWMKCEGLTSSKKLQNVADELRVKVNGPAHRAMADVELLSLVFQKLTFKLKLTLANLIVKWSFSASDLSTGKKKSSSRQLAN